MTTMLSAPAHVKSLTDRHRPATLADVVGQGYVVQTLQDFADSPYPASFLFEGPTGVGKTSAALALANDLGATNAASLWHIEAGQQDGPILEMLKNDLRFAPMCGWRVVVVEEADYMARCPKAAHMWLSILDDLPPRTVFVFTTNHPDKFPQRFLDRCERFTFASDASTLSSDAQLLIDRIWSAERGTADGSPDVANLLGLADDDGNISFRRVVRSLEPSLRSLPPFSLRQSSANPTTLFQAAIDPKLSAYIAGIQAPAETPVQLPAREVHTEPEPTIERPADVPPSPPAVETPDRPDRPDVNLTLTIKGVTYGVELLDGFCRSSGTVRLAKQAGDGEVYDVERTTSGWITCDCKSYQHVHTGTTSPCKHGRALVACGIFPAPGVVLPPPTDPTPEPVPTVETSREDRVAAVLDAMPGLPRSINTVAKGARVSFDFAKKQVMDRFPANGEVFAIDGIYLGSRCCDPSEPEPCTACVPEINFPREKLTEAPSFVPVEGDGFCADEATGFVPTQDHGFCAEAETIVPEGCHTVNEIDHALRNGLPLWDRTPTGFVPEKAPVRPVRPLLPPDGRYSLADLADAQAAFYGGWDSAVGELFARTMRELSANIRMTGASSVAEYDDRVATMERERDNDLRDEGFAHGFDHGVASVGGY